MTPENGSVMVIAGIFEHWTGPDGAVLNTLAILTREAVGVVRQLHDRMPVILPQSNHAAWLDPLRTTQADIRDTLAAPSPRLTATPIGALVNSPRNEGPELLAPVGPPLTQDCI